MLLLGYKRYRGWNITKYIESLSKHETLRFRMLLLRNIVPADVVKSGSLQSHFEKLISIAVSQEKLGTLYTGMMNFVLEYKERGKVRREPLLGWNNIFLDGRSLLLLFLP